MTFPSLIVDALMLSLSVAVQSLSKRLGDLQLERDGTSHKGDIWTCLKDLAGRVLITWCSIG